MTPELLVFLPGLGQTPQTWQEQVTLLPAGMKAVAPWLRGLRPGKPEPFSLDAAADEVLAQLNRYGLDRLALCGFGLGAAVAAHVAARSPAAVSHLVLVAGQIRLPTMVATLQQAAIRRMPERDLARSGIAKEKALQATAELARLDQADSFSRITARTLVICGAEDRANVAPSRRLAATIPGARLELVPGAGHVVNVEAAATFNDLLYQFLQQP